MNDGTSNSDHVSASDSHNDDRNVAALNQNLSLGREIASGILAAVAPKPELIPWEHAWILRELPPGRYLCWSHDEGAVIACDWDGSSLTDDYGTRYTFDGADITDIDITHVWTQDLNQCRPRY